MPAVFSRSDLRFEYPENWSLDETEDDSGDESGCEQVMVLSPETAFWHLSKHAPDIELESLFDEALAALRSEYQDIEVEPAQERLEDHDLEGFDVHFICLDLTNTCRLRACRTPSATFLLICQAEDREFKRVAAVFQAMLASMLRNFSQLD